jgi:hypothetical protein
MPTEIARNSTGNRWLWAGLLAALAVVALATRSQLGAGYHLGDIAALALMGSATFVILISQHHARQAAQDEDGLAG